MAIAPDDANMGAASSKPGNRNRKASADTVPTPAEDIPVGIEADFAPLQANDQSTPERDSDPFHDDSVQAQQAFDEAVRLAEAGDEDGAVRRFLTASKRAEVAREWYLAALAFRRVGDFLLNPKPPCDLDRAFRTYQRAIDAYDRCGLADEKRELSYQLLRLKMTRGNELNLSWVRRIELRFYWAIAGFGLRPFRVLGVAILLVLLFGLLFWAVNGVVHSISGAHCGLWECLYFSGITFCTVGYGDLLPAPHARPLALMEAILGPVTMSFFVVVLANRLRR
jgi:Ion channel